MDWNKDKKLDIISGCYWTDDADAAGHIQILTGEGGMEFAKAKPLLNENDKPLENVVLKNGAEDEEMTSNICTQQHAVDYDADGDLDLVVGCFGSKFFLYENLANNNDGENTLAATPTTLPLTFPGYHSAPHLCDWDNDGDLDLLSGGADGGVFYSENTGTRSKPKWSEFKQLVAKPDAKSNQQRIGASSLAKATRVWTIDANGDGQLDLLVGDSVSVVSPGDGVDEKEFEQKFAELEKRSAELNAKMVALQPTPDAKPDPTEMSELTSAMMELYEERTKYIKTESAGHVWLLIRKTK